MTTTPMRPMRRRAMTSTTTLATIVRNRGLTPLRLDSILNRWPRNSTQHSPPTKMARGYLPVIALTDNQTLAAGSGSPSSSPTSRKGKGKGGGKSKGKGKSNTICYPPSSGGKSDPKGRAKANMTCLRCGQQGHWAANCPQGSSKSTGQK